MKRVYILVLMLVSAFSFDIKAQVNYNIYTAAGDNSQSYGDGNQATSGILYAPYGLAFDKNGNLIVCDYGHSKLRKIAPNGLISTIAGTGGPGFSGESNAGIALNANVNRPQSTAVDAMGNVYMCDQWAAVIRKIDVNGIISRVAGTGVHGYNGDGIEATSARLNNPCSIIFDNDGNLIVSDHENQRIRKIDMITGIITTIAGNGVAGFSAENIPGITAEIAYPWQLAKDASGNIYFTENQNFRIRKLDINGYISTIAGTGIQGNDVSGNALSANLSTITGIAINNAGEIYFSDPLNNKVCKIDLSGNINLIAGTGVGGYNGDNIPAITAELWNPYFIAIDPNQDLIISDFSAGRLRKVSGGIITSIAGASANFQYSEGGMADTSFIGSVQGISYDANGNLYFADYLGARVRRIGANGILNTIAGTGVAGNSGDYSFGALALTAKLNAPYDVVVDSLNNIYFTDRDNHRIRKINAQGEISTIAGTGNPGYTGDNGLAINAELFYPSGLYLDANGNLFFADWQNNVIRKIDVNGIITTVAGNGGAWGYNGDNIAALSASLGQPTGLTFDNNGDMIIADNQNNRIRKVNMTTGIITTIAGTGVQGFNGNGGSALAAELYFPKQVRVDASNNIYFTDAGNNVIRVIDNAGNINSYVGSGIVGYAGDGGPAENAELRFPRGMTVDSNGNLFFTDNLNHCVRKVDNILNNITTYAGTATINGDQGYATLADIYGPLQITVDAAGNIYTGTFDSRIRKITPAGIITTIAGTGVNNSSGDGGLAINAEIINPYAIAVDPTGSNIYFSETATVDGGGNEYSRIRKINVASGIISTICGGQNVTGFSGDGGPAIDAQVSQPAGLTFDNLGNLYFSDMWNNRIRKIDLAGNISTIAGTGNASNTGDGGLALNAELMPVLDVFFKNNELYLLSFEGASLRKINSSGIISTIAGGGNLIDAAQDGQPALNSDLTGFSSVSVDNSGNIFLANDLVHVIKKINNAGIMSKIAGTYNTPGYAGDGNPANNALLNHPGSLESNASGNKIFMVDAGNNVVRMLATQAFINVQPSTHAVCEATNTTFSVTAVNSPFNYQWMINDGSGFQFLNDDAIYSGTHTATLTINNAPIGADSAIFRCLVNGFPNATTLDAYLIVNPKPILVSTAATICLNDSAILNVFGADSFLWSNGLSGSQIVVAPASTALYSVNGTTSFGCTGSTTSEVIVNEPELLEICMVTVNDSSTHNIIYWDKTTLTNTQSFNIYREDVTNVYTLIGNVPFDSISAFHDYSINPNIATKRYKISTIDNCGNESDYSNYHNTILLNDQGNGTFDWNLYEVESSITPVTQYILYRDTTFNYDWYQINQTAGTQTSMVAPNYANYPNCLYRIESNFGFDCDPTRAVNVTRSNIKNHGIVPVGMQQINNSKLIVSPNPAKELISIFTEDFTAQTIAICDALGNEVINATNIQNQLNIIDVSMLSKGSYYVKVIHNSGYILYKKLILN